MFAAWGVRQDCGRADPGPLGATPKRSLSVSSYARRARSNEFERGTYATATVLSGTLLRGPIMDFVDREETFWYTDTSGCYSSAWAGVPKRGVPCLEAL
jgi:hypothetical protein